MQYIPCQQCGRMLPDTWRWYRCSKCGFRVCIYCLDRHRGQYGQGYKCSRCPYGWMKQIEGQGG
jgi:hypothetical protein